MAPVRELEPDFPGFWGPPTSTLDWCEANYDVSFYVAEFWNTISNMFMIVPPMLGAYLAYVDNLETQTILCHLALMVVGLGSSLFHGTLLFEMQLMDELPMIWGTAVLLYSLMEVGGKPKSYNRPLVIGLFIYCLTTTLVYIVVKKPIFHQTAYGFLVVSSIMYSLNIIRTMDHSLKLFMSGTAAYAIGFVIWNMDQIFCDQFRVLRSFLPSFLRPLIQGHAWWHALAGIGAYTELLFGTHARLKFLKRPAVLSFEHLWIYVRTSPPRK